MATIKQIAAETGFSPSTVSIVLRGKSHERNISGETTLKILNTAQRMGYRANIAARRLRANQTTGVMVSVFMAIDDRANVMMRFLLGLKSIAADAEAPFEIVIHSYKSGTLHTLAETIALTHCAIICNASDEDMAFLDTTQFILPIVLFLRNSDKYCTVNVNYKQIGQVVADIFARRGHKHAVLLDTEPSFIGLKHISDTFMGTARRHNISVTQIYETRSMKGGYNGGITIGKMRPLPDCVFAINNVLALGALNAFGKTGIQLPQQMELIGIGTDNTEHEEYAHISISSIHMPLDLLARECVRLLFLQLDGRLDTPTSVEVPFSYVVRESCGA